MVKLISSSEPYRGSFRFDARFLHKHGVQEEIKKAWLTNHPLFVTNVSDRRLKRCRKTLSNWKKKENLNACDKIKQLQCALETEQSVLNPSTVRINLLKKDLVKAYKEEELFWKQRCKEKWGVKGDLNSKYYHASVKANRSRKIIIYLRDSQAEFLPV